MIAIYPLGKPTTEFAYSIALLNKNVDVDKIYIGCEINEKEFRIKLDSIAINSNLKLNKDYTSAVKKLIYTKNSSISKSKAPSSLLNVKTCLSTIPSNYDGDILLMNDDFFILNKVVDLKNFMIHSERPVSYTHSYYGKYYSNARKILTTKYGVNIDKIYNYAIHIPLLLKLNGAKDVINECLEEEISFRQLYGNIYHRGEGYSIKKDIKYHGGNKNPFVTSNYKDFLSTSNQGFTKEVKNLLITKLNSTSTIQQNRVTPILPPPQQENNILVSMIVCFYNAAWCIGKALHSIPDRKDIQVILINDGSTDEWKPIVDEWIKCRKNNLISFHSNEGNKGIGFSRDVAQKYVKGFWQNNFDSDDFWYTDKLTKFLDFLEKAKSKFDLVYFGLDRHSNYVKKIPNRLNYKKFCGGWKFVSNNLIKKAGAKYKNIRCGEDYDFDHQLFKKGYRAYFSKSILKMWNNPNERLTNITAHGAKTEAEIRKCQQLYLKSKNRQVNK